MTTIVKRATRNQISGPNGLLANRTPFSTANGSLRGESGSGYEVTPGRMGNRGSMIVPADAVYVVWSYATPIAYVDANGYVYVTDERFSVTTSKQQGMARAWL